MDRTAALLLMDLFYGETLTWSCQRLGISKQMGQQAIYRLKKRLPGYKYNRKVGEFRFQ